GSAGGIRLQNKGILDLASSVISENVAFLGGGGTFCGKETTRDALDSELVANHVQAGNGAGMLGFSRSSVHLIRCTFSNNVAEYSGAAVYLYGGTSDRPSTLEVGGSMERNLAGFHGGAIAAWHNSVVIISSDVRIHGNRAKIYGGGVHAQTSWVTIRNNVTISNYTAPRGGAMFLDRCRTNISRQVRLTMNRATADGGGIWASNSTVELGNVTRVAECAAAVASANSSIAEKLMLGTMRPCLEVHLDSNHARYGGGIGLEGNWIDAAGMNLERDEADYDGGGLYGATSWVLLQMSLLVENRAVRGAGTMGMDGSNFTVLDAIFANNSASGDGAAIHLYTDVPSSTMRRTRAFGNRAERGAVAFLARERPDNASLFHLNLDDCRSQDNVAEVGGSLVYWEPSEPFTWSCSNCVSPTNGTFTWVGINCQGSWSKLHSWLTFDNESSCIHCSSLEEGTVTYPDGKSCNAWMTNEDGIRSCQTADEGSACLAP
ncbi:hypothetical protein CYMTET_31660, partial [Cymbomonas tetramitiformis]